jgi:hypothetical protein
MFAGFLQAPAHISYATATVTERKAVSAVLSCFGHTGKWRRVKTVQGQRTAPLLLSEMCSSVKNSAG